MATLYELTADLQALDTLLDETTDDEGRRILVSARLATEGQLSEKLDGYGAFIRELEARAAARKAEADRLNQRAKQDDAKASFLKSCLLTHLQETGVKRVETRRFTISVAGNGGKAPMRIEDEMAIPGEFWRVPAPELDREALRLVLESGEEVPGAHLAERGHRLSIR